MVVAFFVASFFMAIDAGHIPPNEGYTVSKTATE